MVLKLSRRVYDMSNFWKRMNNQPGTWRAWLWKYGKRRRINTTILYLFFQAPFLCLHQWDLLLLF